MFEDVEVFTQVLPTAAVPTTHLIGIGFYSGRVLRVDDSLRIIDDFLSVKIYLIGKIQIFSESVVIEVDMFFEIICTECAGTPRNYIDEPQLALGGFVDYLTKTIFNFAAGSEPVFFKTADVAGKGRAF